MLKLSRLYTVLALIVVLACGCGQTKDVPEESQSLLINGADYLSAEGIDLKEGTAIAMVATNADNIFFDVVKQGAMQAVADLNRELGYTGKKEIKLSFAAPKGEDVIEQINIIDQLLDKAPDALCVAFTDASACKTQLDMAKNNGIKLIAFDTPDDGNLTEAIVATDNQAAATEAARKMFEAIGYEGKIAIIAHNSLTETAQVRKQAIIDEMTQNYNDKKIQFVDIVFTNQKDRSEEEVLSELLGKHEDLSGIICTDLQTTEMVIDYAKKQSEINYKIVGFDTSEKIVGEIGNLLVGTVSQEPYDIGYAAVVAAARSIADMGNVANISTNHVWIDQDNLDSEEVQGLLYN